MGGGAPTIDGGMSEEQYRKLQMEEREFMAQQEERQMQLMNEQEDKRSQREAAEKQRQDRIRGKEEALTEMERQISDQTEGFNLEADEEDKDIVMDFYGSLAENASPNAGGKKGGKGKTSGGSGRPQ